MISILIVRFPESSVRAPRLKTLKRISDSDRRGEEEYQCRPRHSRGRHFGVRPEKFGAPFWSDGKLQTKNAQKLESRRKVQSHRAKVSVYPWFGPMLRHGPTSWIRCRISSVFREPARSISAMTKLVVMSALTLTFPVMTGCQATCGILLAKSRPEVDGGSGLPSFL